MSSLVSIIMALLIEFIGVGLPELQQELNCSSNQQIGQFKINTSQPSVMVNNNEVQQEIKAK